MYNVYNEAGSINQERYLEERKKNIYLLFFGIVATLLLLPNLTTSKVTNVKGLIESKAQYLENLKKQNLSKSITQEEVMLLAVILIITLIFYSYWDQKKMAVEMASKLDGLQKNLEKLKKDMDGKLDALNSKLQQLLTLQKSDSDKIKQMKGHIDHITSEFDKLKGPLQDFLNQQPNRQKNLDTMSKDIHDLKSDQSTDASNISSLTTAINDINTALNKIKTLMNKKFSHLESLLKNDQGGATIMAELLAKETQKNLQEQMEDINGLKTILDKATSNIDTLRTELTQAEGTIGHILDFENSDKAHLESKINAQNDNLKNDKKELIKRHPKWFNNANDDDTSTTSKYNSEADLSRLNAQIRDAQSRVDTDKTSEAAANSAVQSAKTTKDTKQGTYDASSDKLSQDIDTKRKHLLAHNVSTGQKVRDENTIRADQEDLRTNKANFDAAKAAYEQALQNASTAKNSSKADIRSLNGLKNEKKIVSDFENNKHNLERDTALKENLETLISQTTNLRTSMSGVNTQLDDVKTTETQIKNKMDSLITQQQKGKSELQKLLASFDGQSEAIIIKKSDENKINNAIAKSGVDTKHVTHFDLGPQNTKKHPEEEHPEEHPEDQPTPS